jgi:hypothetical protein
VASSDKSGLAIFASRVLRVLFQPGRVAHRIMRALPFGSFSTRCFLDLYPRPHYAYGVQQGALLAKALGIPRISVIEFGVAGGNGLIELEKVAAAASAAIGVGIDVYGFDRGEGLPNAPDYRDLPYTWQKGFFKMDVPALKARLTTAQLVLGDIGDTLPKFLSRGDIAPVGFIADDLDYYSSTVDCLKIFDAEDEKLLPRVLCYFDDIVGEEHVLQNDEVGELLAVREFNEAHANTKIKPINGLATKRAVPAAWTESMFAMHRFNHKLYNRYVGAAPQTQQLKLRDSGTQQST